MLPKHRPSAGVILTLAWIALLPAAPSAAETSAGDPGGAAAPAQQAAAPRPANPLATLAEKGGVRKCLPRLGQLADFLTGGGKSGAYLFLPKDKTDERPVSASLEIASGGVTTYASVTASPGAGESCSGLYEAVVYWPKSCLEVAMNHFASTTSRGPLLKGVQMLEGGDSMRVFLLEAGEGCVSIKKEIIY